MIRKEKGMSHREFLKFVDTLPTIEPFTSPTGRPPMSVEKFQLMYKLMFYCALKAVDCFKLKKSDIDLVNSELTITKLKTVEKTTIPPNIINPLRHHIKNLPTSRLLFTSGKVTRELKRSTPTNYEKLAGKKAGLNLFKFSKEKSVEGMTLSIFRNSLEQYMKECKANKNLIDRKLRKKNYQ